MTVRHHGIIAGRHTESLTDQVIGLAIEAHRNTSPGLLETVY